MNAQYQEGKDARREYRHISSCPYAMNGEKMGAIVCERQESDAAKRSWWLAGFHDADMEEGHSVLGRAAS